MVRDGKRQAGAAGFLRHWSVTPCQNFYERPAGDRIAATAVEFFYGGKAAD
jgi:hypothetical protein